MGIKCILEPRNTGYEPTMMGTSPNWTGGKGLKDLVMPTCLAPSDVWPMINAHPFAQINMQDLEPNDWDSSRMFTVFRTIEMQTNMRPQSYDSRVHPHQTNGTITMIPADKPSPQWDIIHVSG